ncbi:MAG: fibronectin type III domain-containing protein [Clostridiales bacterium]|nr:fibronectin type III domain-containing protein [Clostridiales bacterium]
MRRFGLRLVMLLAILLMVVVPGRLNVMAAEDETAAEQEDTQELTLDTPVIESVSNVSSGIKVTYTKVEGAKGYYIYRRTKGNSTYSLVGTVKSGSKLSFTDKGEVKKLSAGKKYYYKVVAYSGDVTSARSSRSAIVYLKSPKIKSVSNTSSGVKIKWSKVTGAKGYYIYRSTTESGGYTRVGTVKSGTTVTFTDEGKKKSLKSGETYYYKVKAYYSDYKSVASDAAGGQYLSAAKIKEITNSSGNIKLTWSKVKGASGYYIYRKKADGSFKKVKTVKDGEKVSWTDKDASKNTMYYYCVKSYSGDTVGAKANYKRFLVPSSSSVTSVAASAGALTVKWEAKSAVTGYQISYSKSSSFENASTVKVSPSDENSTKISGLASNTKYYVRIRCYTTDDGKTFYSTWSSAVSKTTEKKVTVFAGDSITTGLYASVYDGISAVNISGSKQVVAYTGINTTTFRTKEVMDGMTCFDKLVSYDPTRVYFMLGMNEVEWQDVSRMIEKYTELIEEFAESCPDAEIVILSVSPVSSSVAGSRTGFQKIPELNSQLKTMAESLGVNYYDYTDSFKDSKGYLLSKYNGGDGIHWNSKGYTLFGELITEYDNTL